MKNMKKQTEKKLTKKLKIGNSVTIGGKRELIGKNNNYGITLIALIITVIVLLILARHLDFNVKSETITF